MRKICILVPLLLLLPPVFGQDLVVNYTHYTNFINWNDAQKFCKDKHTDLVTIEDDFENDYFYAFGWIGLHQDGSPSLWKWSSTGNEANYTNWAPDEPQHHCAFKPNYTGKWKTDHCSVGHSFTCLDKRLILVRENKTWEEALTYCRTLNYQNSQYDLATLLSNDDHVLAVQIAQVATTDEVWTGLRYLAGYWMWVGGGGSVQYTDIDSCPTQTHCGILLKNSTKLYDLMDCSQRKNFLCYKKP